MVFLLGLLPVSDISDKPWPPAINSHMNTSTVSKKLHSHLPLSQLPSCETSGVGDGLILPDGWNPCNAFQTWHGRWRWWQMGSPFSPLLGSAQQSLFQKLKSSLCTSVTSRVSKGPKAVESYQDVRLRLSKWSQESIARLLVATIHFPKPVQFKNGLHVSSCQDVCSRMFKDIFHLRQEDSTASHLAVQSWSHKKTSTVITFPLLIRLLACVILSQGTIISRSWYPRSATRLTILEGENVSVPCQNWHLFQLPWPWWRGSLRWVSLELTAETAYVSTC